ncbi:MAG: hypothetical protein WBG89_14165 [Ornithinimicrobium sp.]
MTMPGEPTAQQRLAGRFAAVVVGLEAVVIAGFAAFYGVELVLGEGSDPVVVIMSIVTMLVFVIGLAYVSAGLWTRHPRAQAPAMAFNGLMIPLGLTLFQFAPTAVAVAVLGAGLAVILAAFRMGQLD